MVYSYGKQTGELSFRSVKKKKKKNSIWGALLQKKITQAESRWGSEQGESLALGPHLKRNKGSKDDSL